LFLQTFYLYVYNTCEGMNAYRHKYSCNHIYIYIYIYIYL
jgi:hypothetical protein